MKKLLIISLIILTIISFNLNLYAKEDNSINMAVEFVDHASSAYIAKSKGWYQKEGLEISTFENYITGMALSAALTRSDIDAAYMCLIPAICSYANGNVPLKVIAGTHKYGYGLLVNQEKIASIEDLKKPGIKIGCPRAGSPNDVLLHKMIEKYDLDKKEILKKVRRMSPAKVLFSLKTGQLDAGFCCEQFPSMGQELGFKLLVKAEDLWPQMQGSVVVVNENLLKNSPQKVEKIVKINQRATDFINTNPQSAAEIVAAKLQAAEEDVLAFNIDGNKGSLNINSDVIYNSLTKNMECSTDINPKVVQDVIDYMADLGYIERFEAEEILELRYLENEKI